MKILVVGCGGRENILIEKLNKDKTNELYCTGPWINPDIYEMCKEYSVMNLTEDNVFNFCVNIKPDIIIIGPEALLETNLVTRCITKGFNCIAPIKELAQLETSKIFTRKFLEEHELTKYNPKFKYIENINDIENTISYFNKFVIKLDGLAGGKGVFVQEDHFKTTEEGIKIINEKIKNNKILIEEKLYGEEFSLLTFSDGFDFIHLPPIQDYKRAYENDKGPNTGGMGSVMEKFNFLTDKDIINCENLNSRVLIKIRQKYKIPYIGILYGSFIKTNDNKLKLIEYNCRFGDSEIFNALNCIETDLSLLFKKMSEHKLNEYNIKISSKISIVKYLVPNGYPITPERKQILYEKIPNVYSASIDNNLNLLGSRAIAVYAEGKNKYEAYSKCEILINKINKNNNLYWRQDIGLEKNAYKSSGVDIDKGNDFVKLIKQNVESTYNSNVLGKHGNFGGQYKYNNNVLVASTDGVGTKSILVKKYTDNYYICGFDIVNHSINDILVQGAIPLFFLDYVATSKLNIKDTESFVNGCCDACKKVNCVLLGGETAEMPSVYKDGHMDMVGTIVGEKKIDLLGVQENDIAIGLPSSGPQTNGYTLIRKILEYHEPPKHILDKLISPHGSFLEKVLNLNKEFTITGMCHITGGGLTENLKRTIPNDLHIDLEKIEYPDWCQWLKEKGNISDNEMKKTFNCGIGFIVFIKTKDIYNFDNIIYLGQVKKNINL